MKKLSFRKFEHMIHPKFRKEINAAESTEDIKKVFCSTISGLLNDVLGGTVAVDHGDVHFTPHLDPYFSLEKRLLMDPRIHLVWEDSDLLKVIGEFAETAMHHHKHLEKHREKTNAKIR